MKKNTQILSTSIYSKRLHAQMYFEILKVFFIDDIGIFSNTFSDHEMGHALFGQTETKMVLRPREAIDSLDDSIFMESPHKKEHFKTVSNITLKR